MPRRRKKSPSATPHISGPAVEPPATTAQGLTNSSLHLLEPFLSVLVSAGVQEFHGFGVHVRLGPRPVVERRVPVPVPMSPEGSTAPPMPGPTAPLTPESREAVLSRLETGGVDEGDPLFDAVRRSSS